MILDLVCEQINLKYAWNPLTVKPLMHLSRHNQGPGLSCPGTTFTVPGTPKVCCLQRHPMDLLRQTVLCLHTLPISRWVIWDLAWELLRPWTTHSNNHHAFLPLTSRNHLTDKGHPALPGHHQYHGSLTPISLEGNLTNLWRHSVLCRALWKPDVSSWTRSSQY